MIEEVRSRRLVDWVEQDSFPTNTKVLTFEVSIKHRNELMKTGVKSYKKFQIRKWERQKGREKVEGEVERGEDAKEKDDEQERRNIGGRGADKT